MRAVGTSSELVPRTTVPEVVPWFPPPYGGGPGIWEPLRSDRTASELEPPSDHHKERLGALGKRVGRTAGAARPARPGASEPISNADLHSTELPSKHVEIALLVDLSRRAPLSQVPDLWSGFVHERAKPYETPTEQAFSNICDG